MPLNGFIFKSFMKNVRTVQVGLLRLGKYSILILRNRRTAYTLGRLIFVLWQIAARDNEFDFGTRCFHAVARMQLMHTNATAYFQLRHHTRRMQPGDKSKTTGTFTCPGRGLQTYTAGHRVLNRTNGNPVCTRCLARLSIYEYNRSRWRWSIQYTRKSSRKRTDRFVSIFRARIVKSKRVVSHTRGTRFP